MEGKSGVRLRGERRCEGALKKGPQGCGSTRCQKNEQRATTRTGQREGEILMEERPRHGGVLSWGADAAAVLTSSDRAEADHRKGRRS